MRIDGGLAAHNRLRIAVLIVLATISFWLATVVAAVAATLTVVLGILLQAGDVPDSVDGWKAVAIFLGAVVLLAAIVGTFIALFRLPLQRRRLEEQVMRETRARIAEPDDRPRVRNLLEGLAIAAAVPVPRFALIDDGAPNSFSVGTRPNKTIVALTTGLIESLTRDELEAVLAYEVSRIGSWDIALSSWTVALTGSAIKAVDDDDDEHFIRGLLGYLPRIFAQWLQTFALKDQVRGRDRIAVEFTRNPAALVRALEKLHADESQVGFVTRATAPLWIEFPNRVAGTTRFAQRLTRELALDGRIAQLRELAGMQVSED